MVLFLHDEAEVHTPVALADDVAIAFDAAAAAAGQLLFGTFPVDLPRAVAIVDDYC